MKSILGDKLNNLNEIGGLIGRSSPSQQQSYQQSSSQQLNYTGNFSNVFPLCSKMHGWQSRIYGNLKRETDLYVAASPSAGKTLPFVCHWLHNIIAINVIGREAQNLKEYLSIAKTLLHEPEKLKKLLILVPIRQLAIETTKDFQESFAKVISEFFRTVIRGITDFYTPIIPATPGRQTGGYMYGNQTEHHMKLVLAGVNAELFSGLQQRKNKIKELQDAQEQANYKLARRIESEINGIDQKLDELVRDGIHRQINKLVSIKTGLINHGDPEKAPVTISIYESTPRFIGKIADQVQLLVLDESHLIQQIRKKVVENDIRAHNIAGSLYHVLDKLRRTKYTMIFLSGTANPDSAASLMKYLNICYNRKFREDADKKPIVTQPPSTAVNPSSIAIEPDDSVNNERTLLNILKNSRETAIVLFSKKRINDLATKAIKAINPTSLPNIQGGTLQKTKIKSTYGSRPSYTGTAKQYDIDPNEMATRAVEKKLTTAELHDPFLRKCVQAGFGYLYRVDERDYDFKKRKNDNQIVSTLFTKGKIRVILATDAIGVGINIKVRNLVIPSIEKFDGGSRSEMDPATLAQLLHRTGRGAFEFARIVTPQKNVGSISNALSLAPSGFTKGVTITKIHPSMCRLLNFFQSIWSDL